MIRGRSPGFSRLFSVISPSALLLRLFLHLLPTCRCAVSKLHRSRMRLLLVRTIPPTRTAGTRKFPFRIVLRALKVNHGTIDQLNKDDVKWLVDESLCFIYGQARGSPISRREHSPEIRRDACAATGRGIG